MDEVEVVVLTDENGEEIKFEHLDTLQVSDKTYVVCVPYLDDEMYDENDEVEDEVVIFNIKKDSDEQDVLVQVESDDELSMVFDEFKQRNIDLYEFTE